MFGVNMFFVILSVLLVYVAFNKRVNMLVDKTLQVCEIKLEKVLKEKDNLVLFQLFLIGFFQR